jgi:hypothetical protein
MTCSIGIAIDTDVGESAATLRGGVGRSALSSNRVSLQESAQPSDFIAVVCEGSDASRPSPAPWQHGAEIDSISLWPSALWQSTSIEPTWDHVPVASTKTIASNLMLGRIWHAV